MKVLWTKNAASDLKYWKKTNPKTVKRIKELLENIKINHFAGIGKPEPLKYDLSGYWSRRITGSHRLVYRVNEEGDIVILQCRYHYK